LDLVEGCTLQPEFSGQPEFSSKKEKRELSSVFFFLLLFLPLIRIGENADTRTRHHSTTPILIYF
jgi:hypothetical protein